MLLSRSLGKLSAMLFLQGCSANRQRPGRRAQSLPVYVASKVQAILSVSAAKVEVVWNPPWDPSKMSEAARRQFGMM